MAGEACQCCFPDSLDGLTEICRALHPLPRLHLGLENTKGGRGKFLAVYLSPAEIKPFPDYGAYRDSTLATKVHVKILLVGVK